VTKAASLSHPEAFLSPLVIAEAVQRALNEDLGRAGDITSIATIPENSPGPCRPDRAAGRSDRGPAACSRGVSKFVTGYQYPGSFSRWRGCPRQACTC